MTRNNILKVSTWLSYFTAGVQQLVLLALLLYFEFWYSRYVVSAAALCRGPVMLRRSPPRIVQQQEAREEGGRAK